MQWIVQDIKKEGLEELNKSKLKWKEVENLIVGQATEWFNTQNITTAGYA